MLVFVALIQTIFIESYGFKSLIIDSTCFKNSDNLLFIDLVLTNNPFFLHSAIETGISGFHNVVVTVTKTTFQKLSHKTANYREFKKFSNNFRQQLLSDISSENISTSSNDLILYFSIFAQIHLMSNHLVRRNNK